LSFEIYHPQNNVHNQDGNHDDNKVRITFFSFELTDGQNFLPGMVQLISKLSSTPQKSRSRFITVFSTCKDAFLKFESHIFYIG
jgi:hypothetical protein